MNDERQRELAQHLRNELDNVIEDASERSALQADLDAALALGGAEGDRQLAEVLRARPQTRDWMRARDPDATDSDRLSRLAGDAADLGTHFICPEEDYDFIRDHVSDVVPLCPKHKVPLVPAPE
jgi:hypothetical protein